MERNLAQEIEDRETLRRAAEVFRRRFPDCEWEADMIDAMAGEVDREEA